MNLRVASMILGIFLLSSACSQSEEGSDTSFGIFTDSSDSILLALESGEIDVCYSISGGRFEAREIETSVRRGLRAWIRALYLDPLGDWTTKDVHINFDQATYRECASEPRRVLKVQHFGREEFRQVARASGRSYALRRSREINIDTMNRESRDIDYVHRHELGHLMGLGDTYFIAGKNTPVGQPDSCMKTHGKKLTNDDVAGVRASYQFLRNGFEECPAGYREGEAEYNYRNQLFCVPTGSGGARGKYACSKCGVDRRNQLMCGQYDKNNRRWLDGTTGWFPCE